MTKDKLIQFLKSTNEKSFKIEDIMALSQWNINQVLKFLKQLHSFSISKKFLVKIDLFDKNNKPILLKKKGETYIQKYTLVNLEYLSEERKIDLELAKLLLDKDFQWVRFDDYSELMYKNKILPYFSTDLNESYYAIELLNNFFFKSQRERTNKMKMYEAITYNCIEKKDIVIVKEKNSSMAIAKCILEYKKQH